MTDNQEIAFHDEVVAKVDETLETSFSGIPLDGDVASVCRDILSASAPIVFGNGTTETLLKGENLTPNDPSADAMSLRYDDLLEGRDGQIVLLETMETVARVAISLIEDPDSLIVAHLSQRIGVITATLGWMRGSVKKGETIQPRTPEQKTLFLAQSILRRIRFAHGNGILITGFTSGPTYEGGEAGGRSKIHLRSEDLAKLEVLETRNELERKYSVDSSDSYSEFAHLIASLRVDWKYEDHEQAYLFVQEKGEGNDLPTYEVRIRRVTTPQGESTCYLTIKCGDGESRTETNCKIGEDLYDALLRLRQEEYSVIHKRRYLVSKDNTAETTIDRTLLADGTFDFSAEVEFNPEIIEIPADFVKPAWAAAERKGKEWKMRNVAKVGWMPPQTV